LQNKRNFLHDIGEWRPGKTLFYHLEIQYKYTFYENTVNLNNRNKKRDFHLLQLDFSGIKIQKFALLLTGGCNILH